MVAGELNTKRQRRGGPWKIERACAGKGRRGLGWNIGGGRQGDEGNHFGGEK